MNQDRKPPEDNDPPDELTVLKVLPSGETIPETIKLKPDDQKAPDVVYIQNKPPQNLKKLPAKTVLVTAIDKEPTDSTYFKDSLVFYKKEDLDYDDAIIEKVKPVILKPYVASLIDEEKEEDDEETTHSKPKHTAYTYLFGAASSVFIYRTVDGRAFAAVIPEGKLKEQASHTPKGNRVFTVLLNTKEGLDDLIYYRGTVGLSTGLSDAIKRNLKNNLEYVRVFASRDGMLIQQSPRIFFSEGNSIYYDLHDDNQLRHVKITKDGYSIENRFEPRFNKSPTQGSQVDPVSGGSLAFFDKNYKNIGEDQLLLLKIWLLCAFIPGIQKPILLLLGERGSGKTTLAGFLNALIDPMPSDMGSATSEPLTLPSKRSDLFLTVEQHYFVAFDNVQKIKDSLSNDFCQVVTGQRVETRKLYTDSDLIIKRYKRAVLITSIDLGTLRADLVDRSYAINLPRLPSRGETGEKGRANQDIEEEFLEQRPAILGAIFHQISEAMKIYPDVKLTKFGRMPQFQAWGYSLAESLGKGIGDRFLSAYHNLIKKQDDQLMIDSPLLIATHEVMRRRTDTEWRGNMTEFRQELLSLVTEPGLDYLKKHVGDPSVLGRWLAANIGLLAYNGIIVTKLHEGGTGNVWSIKKILDHQNAIKPSEPGISTGHEKQNKEECEHP